MLVGFFIGVLSFLGDILESSIKRSVGVKDSGNLIPGHGGLMDRLDGYIIVLPVFYVSNFTLLDYYVKFKNIILLGATGSMGKSTLNLLKIIEIRRLINVSALVMHLYLVIC